MTERERSRCDDITELIDAALEDVLSTGGTQHTYDPGPGQHSDWLDDWREMDGERDTPPDPLLESALACIEAAHSGRADTCDDAETLFGYPIVYTDEFREDDAEVTETASEPSPEPWQLFSDPEWDWPTVPERWHRWFRRRHR